MQIEELSAEWRNICRSKNCLQIEEVFDLQTEEFSAERGELFADEIVCRLKDYFNGRLKNNLQIKEVFDLQVEHISMDQRTICK